MTKTQAETLAELKRKATKAMTLCKKIEEASENGMKHRTEDYFKELEKTVDELNEMHKQLKP